MDRAAIAHIRREPGGQFRIRAVPGLDRCHEGGIAHELRQTIRFAGRPDRRDRPPPGGRVREGRVFGMEDPVMPDEAGTIFGGDTSVSRLEAGSVLGLIPAQPGQEQGEIPMPSGARRQRSGTGGKLAIGALSRATGIPIETLRTWERRYGFPIPERKPSGHRVYPLSSVPRLRRIAEALGRGHRAAEVVGASKADLTELIRATPGAMASRLAPPALPADPSELLRYVKAFDGGALTRQLLADWALLGPLDFLRGRVAPLVRAVGDAWESGDLDVRHEHFLSERVGDLLRALRLQLEERATGPLVIFTSLPGESHGLGLQMAALVLAMAGCRVLNLGTETPVPEVATLARDLNARVVAVSVSVATRGRTTTTHLARLRSLLPRKMTLLVGGEGAPRSRKGLLVIQELGDLEAWGRRLMGDGSALTAHGR